MTEMTVILNKKNLAKAIGIAVQVMLKGGCIVYPTDTVYGLGADATNEQAVRKVFKHKGRTVGKGVASIFQSIKQINQFCEVTPEQKKILEQYLPGPYTFLLKPRIDVRIARQLIDEKRRTIGVRMPNHPFTQALANRLGRPYTTTSANRSGLPSPKTIDQVNQYLTDGHFDPRSIQDRQGSTDPGSEQSSEQSARAFLLIDGGRLFGTPSTVIDLTKTPPELVRQGAGGPLPK